MRDCKHSWAEEKRDVKNQCNPSNIEGTKDFYAERNTYWQQACSPE